jgi:hypothetical protein
MERDANGKYYDGIINPYNGHNRKLVDAICDAWDEQKEKFAPILYAFCLRDRVEITEKFTYVPMTPEMALDFAHEIMEHVCDDLDLECILKFLRVDF